MDGPCPLGTAAPKRRSDSSEDLSPRDLAAGHEKSHQTSLHFGNGTSTVCKLFGFDTQSLKHGHE